METNEKANPVALDFLITETIALDFEGSFHALRQFQQLLLFVILYVFVYSIIEYGKSRTNANFGYAAKIGFALKGINGIDLIRVAA